MVGSHSSLAEKFGRNRNKNPNRQVSLFVCSAVLKLFWGRVQKAHLIRILRFPLLICLVVAFLPSFTRAQDQAKEKEKERPVENPTAYRTIQVDGLSIFYREAGPKDAPTILLLHGLPSSSRMFEPLFARLSDRYHLIAPDYPGFGHSDWPD